MALDQYIKPGVVQQIINNCEACGDELSDQEIKSDFRLCGKRICLLCNLTIMMNKDKIARIIKKKQIKESIEEEIEEQLEEEPNNEEDSDPF